MRAYTSKEELKDEIKKTYTKFIAEFDNIPEEMKDLRAEDVDRTPAENLAYKVGWTTLVLKWEQDERNGLEVKTPSDQFKWNQLGELYQWFTDTVPFPVSWTVKMKKKQKETQDILSYHTQAAGCSDKARAKASGGRQPIEECGRTGL